MTDHRRDEDLGMSRPVTRRDFLDGLAVTAAALAATPSAAFAEPSTPTTSASATSAPYPPAMTGLRGDAKGTFTQAHRVRDSVAWEGAPCTSTGERYDLVVVGGGISGLAAAWFYRKQHGAKARILVLDNHDDFGGHATRNEFTVNKRFLISYGGTQSFETPSRYSKVAKGLIRELGIDMKKFDTAFDQHLYERLKLGTGIFFDQQTFGRDALVAGAGDTPWPKFLAQCPLSDAARRDIARLYTQKTNYMPGLNRRQKRQKLAKTSYADFLVKICKASPDVLPFFQTFPHDLFCVGIDAVSALECYDMGTDYGLDYPGFDGLDLGAADVDDREPYIHHFPDGNASVARMLVRSLVPGSIEGHTMEDIVTARADYSRLDRSSSAVRIRLGSTVVRAQHVGNGKAVNVVYVQGDRLQSVQATHCVMACYNAMIPYLCPELPKGQREALSALVRSPLVYTHVAVRNWTSFQKLGVRHIVSPGSYHSYTSLDFPVSMGKYTFPSSPQEPAVLYMLRTPCSPGLSLLEQYKEGRIDLLQTPFSTFEREIRDHLGRMLGGGGFDPARDITAITVNRWAHGYALEGSTLWNLDWDEGDQPWVIGREPFGRITIANSDSGGLAYTDSAIDQAWRAVKEIGRDDDA